MSLDCVQSQADNNLSLSTLNNLIGSKLFNLVTSASISDSLGGVPESNHVSPEYSSPFQAH